MQASASTPVKASVAAIFAASLLAAWVVGSAHVAPYLLPAPAGVARAALAFFTSPRQLGHLGITLFHIGASIALSFVIGAALALLAHMLPMTAPTIHRRLSPFLNSFSGIGWTLLGVIWFGVSSLSVIFAISVVLLPFAIVNLREGLASQDRELVEMSRSFGRDRWRIMTRVTLPALVPFIAATLRIMFGVSWKVALTAELFGGDRGLGYVVNLARQDYDTETIFTVILFIVISVYLADRFIFLRLERATARRFGARAP